MIYSILFFLTFTNPAHFKVHVQHKSNVWIYCRSIFLMVLFLSMLRNFCWNARDCVWKTLEAVDEIILFQGGFTLSSVKLEQGHLNPVKSWAYSRLGFRFLVSSTGLSQLLGYSLWRITVRELGVFWENFLFEMKFNFCLCSAPFFSFLTLYNIKIGKCLRKSA